MTETPKNNQTEYSSADIMMAIQTLATDLRASFTELIDQRFEEFAIIVKKGFDELRAELNEFKTEMCEFRDEMYEFKVHMKAFENRTDVTLFNIDNKLITVEHGLTSTEKILAPLVRDMLIVKKEIQSSTRG